MGRWGDDLNQESYTASHALTYYDTVDPMLLLIPSGNLFKCHEEVWSLQPMIPPKRFDIFPPDWGMLRRSRCVRTFLQKLITVLHMHTLVHGRRCRPIRLQKTSLMVGRFVCLKPLQ